MARWVGGSVIGLLIIGLAWLVVTGLIARGELSRAQDEATLARHQISQNDVDGALNSAHKVAAAAHKAHQLTTGPAWWVASKLPWLGRPAETVQGLTASADVLGQQVVLPISVAGQGFEPGRLLSNGSVRLQPIIAAAAPLRRADTALTATTQQVNKLPETTWLHTVDHARERYLGTLNSLSGQLSSLDDAVQVLPSMLGQKSPQRYFVGLENEAESRGLGGIPGAFAIVVADQGRISFERFESDTVLDKVSTGLDLSADYNARYASAAPWDTYPNSTIGPDFSDAARIWAAMWQNYSGEKIDGAVTLDPTAMAYLLKVTGPATLPDGQQVSAANVVSLTEQTLYSRYPDTTQRKAYLIGIAQAISKRIISAHGSKSLLAAVQLAAKNRRLLVWSADNDIENVLRPASLSGTLNAGDNRFSGFTVTNGAGNKLDYYLKRAMTYRRVGCGSNAVTTANLTLTNDAPASGLPAYVTLREDHPNYPTQPGDNKLLISYYATPGTQFYSVTAYGQKLSVTPGSEHGLTVFTIELELRRGATATVSVVSGDNSDSNSVDILRQPGVNPLTVKIDQPSC